NTLRSLKETRYDKSKQQKTEVKYLKNLLQEVAPEELRSTVGSSTIDIQRKIISAVATQKEKGIEYDENIIMARDFQAEPGREHLSLKDIENSQLVMQLQDQSLQLIEELEEQNKRVQKLQSDIESGELSKAEGKGKILEVINEKHETGKIVGELIASLNDLLQVADPEFMPVFEEMKVGLEELLEEEEDSDIEAVQELSEEAGVKAEEALETANSIDTQDSAIFKDRVNIEKEFNGLKGSAKKVLGEFIRINRLKNALREKAKTPPGLNDEEKKQLADCEKTLAELQNQSETILNNYIVVEQTSQGAIKEASKLSISAFEGIVKRKEITEEVSGLVKKNEEIIEELTEGEENLNLFFKRFWKKIISYNPGGFKKEYRGLIRSYDQLGREISEKKQNIEALKAESGMREEESKKGLNGYHEQSLQAIEEKKLALAKAEKEKEEMQEQRNSLKEKIEEEVEKIDELEKGFHTLFQQRGVRDTKSFHVASPESDGLEDMVEVEGAFYIDKFPVTLEKYMKFVLETGYQTYAEKNGFAWVYSKNNYRVEINTQGQQKIIRSVFKTVEGACWYNAEGETGNIREMTAFFNYPVVQITYTDALEYAKLAGKRLPREEEWVLAAFGKNREKFPWGDLSDESKCNHNKSPFSTLSPVDTFEPNRYGAYDMLGNVWEYCESEDSEKKFIVGGCWNMEIGEMGIGVRQSLTPLEYSNTIGFRCAKDK
ncbi:MAG: SUMF1/EgtB/PvdO family nonheme iron enzyme, partial [Deltaproteobacteria bacterium]|nr:SUMF1/EgtB/PvdO family nonheme iron enzyme [Deltaproteobacteria bacterium]